MTQLQKTEYSIGLSQLSNWNKTTVIRTHYRLKPHTADKLVQKVTSLVGIKAVFYSVENDTGVIDFTGTNLGINHLHLLLSYDNRFGTLSRQKLSKAMNTNVSSVLNIENIKGVKNVCGYVTKLLNSNYSHHNYFING